MGQRNFFREKSKARLLMFIVLGLIFAGLVIFFATGQPQSAGTLQVDEQAWTGSSEEQNPKKTVFTGQPAVGNTVNLRQLNGDRLPLTIKSVDSDQIRLTVNGVSLKQGSALQEKGIDLNGCKNQDFTLRRGERAELHTCTTDAGKTWLLEYR